MDQLALFFSLMLAAIVMVPLSDRMRLPSPVLMTLIGAVLAAIPQVTDVRINPDLILLLPPLLYAAVQRTSWRQFAANWRAIFLLAVGLVFVTTAAVAAVADAVVPGITVAAAFTLGALVAPPDPVAATAVAGSLGLPRRMISTLVLQGLTLPWLVKRLGVRSGIDAEHDLEKMLALRAMTAAKQRLREIEAAESLSDELSEQLHRRAFDLGARICPDVVDDERRESQARRAKRLRSVRRIQEDMMSAARHEVLAARSEPGYDPEVVDRVLRHLDLRSLRGA